MNFKSKWWQFAQATALAGALAGCDNPNNPIPPPEAINTRGGLTTFSGDLEQYLEDTAVLQMRSQLEAMRDEVPGWGWWGFRGGFGGLDNLEASAAGSAAPPSAPSAYTQTNNQVQGVDEADFVKNDGTRIFSLSGDRLYAVKSWPASELGVQGSLKIEGWPRELFIDGTDTAVVFSTVYQWYPMSHAGSYCLGLDCGYYYSNTVKVTHVDVSDMANLQVTKEVYLPGSYLSARKVGSSVRVVLTDSFNYPDGFKWGPEWSEGLWNDKPRLRAAYDRAIAENELLIRAQTLAHWLPASQVKVNGVTHSVPHACSDVSRVNGPTRLGQVSVVTLDLTGDSFARSTILAEAGEVYASQNNLYVATQHWWWWPAPGQRDATYIHKFDISQPAQATYVASGVVDGQILDQFSLDEAATGELRVVTTINNRVPDLQNPDNWWGTVRTTNRLSVLRDNQGFLQIIGASQDLAEGERVTSSRIVGNRGYVVTFEQVDPLFTFDLSVPEQPTLIGQVKIPGFSSYMHPLDENHLLTIGTYMDEDANWQSRRLQLAIFDVTDMANPQQTHVQLVGSLSSYSEAQSEHKAFNYFAAKKLLAIPFTDWSWDASDYWSAFRSELKVYGVDAQTGFVEKGAVSLRDLYQVQDYYSWRYYYEPWVRRSVMADDFVYAISDSGIRVAHISNLAQPVQTAPFTRYTGE